MSFADVAEECIQTRYPRKAWIGRLVTPLLLSPAVFTMAVDAPCALSCESGDV